jgi:hypothetical protein
MRKKCMDLHKVAFAEYFLWKLGYDKEPADTLNRVVQDVLTDLELTITCCECEAEASYLSSQMDYIEQKHRLRNRDELIAARQKRQASATTLSADDEIPF